MSFNFEYDMATGVAERRPQCKLGSVNQITFKRASHPVKLSEDHVTKSSDLQTPNPSCPSSKRTAFQDLFMLIDESTKPRQPIVGNLKEEHTRKDKG